MLPGSLWTGSIPRDLEVRVPKQKPLPAQQEGEIWRHPQPAQAGWKRLPDKSAGPGDSPCWDVMLFSSPSGLLLRPTGFHCPLVTPSFSQKPVALMLRTPFSRYCTLRVLVPVSPPTTPFFLSLKPTRSRDPLLPVARVGCAKHPCLDK